MFARLGMRQGQWTRQAPGPATSFSTPSQRLLSAPVRSLDSPSSPGGSGIAIRDINEGLGGWQDGVERAFCGVHNDPTQSRGWPVEAFVAIVGADAQGHVLIPIHTLEALPASDRSVLLTSGEVEWFAPEVVRQALRGLLSRVSEPDAEPVRRAIDLTEYACTTGTGVAVAPPPTRR